MLQNIEILVWKAHAKINITNQHCSNKIILYYYPYRATLIKEDQILMEPKLIHSYFEKQACL